MGLRMIRQHVALIMMLLVTAASGCGSGGLGLVPVEGTVRLNGEPLADAQIIFRPEAGGRPSGARTDEEGHFSLEYMEGQLGALTGKHKVSISTFIEADPDSSNPLIMRGQAETLPAEYNKQTTLQVELESGNNEPVDFDLKSSRKS